MPPLNSDGHPNLPVIMEPKWYSCCPSWVMVAHPPRFSTPKTVPSSSPDAPSFSASPSVCSQYTLLPVASGSPCLSGLTTHPRAPRTPQKFVTRSLITLFSSSKSVIRFSLSLLWNPVLTMNCGIRAQSFPFSLREAPSCSSCSSRFGLNVTFLEKPPSPCSPIPAQPCSHFLMARATFLF